MFYVIADTTTLAAGETKTLKLIGTEGKKITIDRLVLFASGSARVDEITDKFEEKYLRGTFRIDEWESYVGARELIEKLVIIGDNEIYFKVTDLSGATNTVYIFGVGKIEPLP